MEQDIASTDESLTTATEQPPLTLLTISIETLATICENLPRQDLRTFSFVCKHLWNLLSSPTSSLTQQIWRESRITFSPHRVSKPPKMLSEQQYWWLTRAEKCKFCRTSNIDFLLAGIASADIRIYWEFGVKSCVNCLSSEGISRENISKDIPIEVIDILPHVNVRGQKLYWPDQIKAAVVEYNLLANEDEKEEWIRVKQQELIETRLRCDQIRQEDDQGLSIAFFTNEFS